MAPKISKPVAKKLAVKQNQPGPLKKLRYGSDFSGLGTQSLILHALADTYKLPLRLDHVFSCDKLPSSRMLIKTQCAPAQFDSDICSRADPGAVDFYQFTAPCQALSTLGHAPKGASDARTLVVLHSLVYVEKNQPAAVVSENVETIATHKKFKKLFDFIQARLLHAGYHVEWQIINTNMFGIPQHRRRCYLVGVRKDLMRTRDVQSVWPSPIVGGLSMKQIAPALPESIWKPHPPSIASPAYGNVMKSYKLLGKGVNPFLVPVVVDAGSSERFSSYKVGEAPTLTRSRCSQRDGYWCSTKGSYLNVDELAELQGFTPLLGTATQWKEAKISTTQYGGMIGNAQSANFLLLLYPRVLYAAQLITAHDLSAVEDRVRARICLLTLPNQVGRAVASSSSATPVQGVVSK